jgi:hypothetical protein
MKYAVEMGSGTMIFTPSFIKIGSDIQKLMGGGDSQAQRQHVDHISLLPFFFKRREVGQRLKSFSLLDNFRGMHSAPA